MRETYLTGDQVREHEPKGPVYELLSRGGSGNRCGGGRQEFR